MKNKNIPLAKPLIGRNEKRAVQKVLNSGNLAQGPVVAEFESSFSKFVGDDGGRVRVYGERGERGESWLVGRKTECAFHHGG